ncbi:hypothetical protein [Weissella viridescens]|uniref:hypothetical protein n=1 Tax=Weissella viridescens TaxID=1629 RepID=UPI003AF2486D
MKKSVKIVIAIVILLVVALGGGYGIHQYQKNAELKNTNSITNRKGGQDVTWDTIKTAAKSNDVLVVFVDSTTPYFNPVMKAVDAEVKQSTKNNPKVLVVDRHQQSYAKLSTEIDSTQRLGDYASAPYAIAYKKSNNLSKNTTTTAAGIHYKYKGTDERLNTYGKWQTDDYATPTTIAEAEDGPEESSNKKTDVSIYQDTLNGFFNGEWLSPKEHNKLIEEE